MNDTPDSSLPATTPTTPQLTARMQHILELIKLTPLRTFRKELYSRALTEVFSSPAVYKEAISLDDSNCTLSQYFVWEATVQGHSYWSELHQALLEVPDYWANGSDWHGK